LLFFILGNNNFGSVMKLMAACGHVKQQWRKISGISSGRSLQFVINRSSRNQNSDTNKRQWKKEVGGRADLRLKLPRNLILTRL